MGFLPKANGGGQTAITLAADTATIDTGADAIPAGYSVLEVFAMLRTDEAAATSSVLVQFNGDNGSNYNRQYIGATNANTFASAPAGATGINLSTLVAGDNATANLFSPVTLVVPGYASTAFHKTGSAKADIPSPTAAQAQTYMLSWQWASTAAIQQIALSISSGSGQKFKAGSLLVVRWR